MARKLSKELTMQVEELLRQYAGEPQIDKKVSTETDVPSETVRSIRRRIGVRTGQMGRPKKDGAKPPKPTDDLTRVDRIERLQLKMESDSKYQILAKMLDKSERLMFLDEFTNIAVDMETLDAFEESHLYTAVMNFVLGTRYAMNYQDQRESFQRFCESDFFGATDIDQTMLPRNMRPVPPNEGLMEEFHKSTDTFNKIRDKFARIQEEKRKRITADKRSFLDYLSYYDQRDKRDEAIMEIADIAKKTDEELKRMIESKELEGYFDKR